MPSGHKGFTIIEVAMVLVIIGMIIGFGASLVGPLTIRAKRIETKETVQAAVEAVIGFAASNDQRLPNDAEFRALLRKQNDAFSKPLYYVFDSNLIIARSICNRKTTFITVQEPTPSIQNVAFMVLSSGENFNNQTTGDRNVSAAVTINVYDTGTAGIDNYATDMNRPEEYDDIYQMVTLNELRTKTGCQGPPLRIVNNELPPGSATVTYNIDIYADGGVTTSPYSWSIVSASPSTPSWTIGSSGIPNTILSGTPPTSGAYYVKVRVNDSDGNIADKSFVITINP
jgi:prepilin-type N-terminal cleavage/methylation domain-containing protein